MVARAKARRAKLLGRRELVVLLALGLGLALSPADLTGASEKETDEKRIEAEEKTHVAAAPPELPVYRPPARGKPRARVGGAVRGVGREWPAIAALVPDHIGLTVSRRPSLFWYLEGAVPSDASLVFALTEEESVDPLIEGQLPTPRRSGIQRIDLADFDFELRTGQEYQWTVALVFDPAQRAKDIVAVGYILRVEPPSSLGPERPASVQDYAANGLWYDALAAAADRTRREPGDPAARAARDGLLRQVGLEVSVAAPVN
jgi:hypothetical protein